MSTNTTSFDRDGKTEGQVAPLTTTDGTVHVAAFPLPVSSLLDVASRDLLLRWGEWSAKLAERCPGHWADPEAVCNVRQFYDENYYPALVKATKELYSVRIQSQVIAGVYTEVFTPSAGVPERNRQFVLVNLHGGGFTVGARNAGQVESIPVAAIGEMKVISVDYRLAPEFEFPAATDDVVAVYRELLKEYAPENIGIYGCSAGAVLTAQAVARFQSERMALPAAVGMLCGAGNYWAGGDSAHLMAARLDQKVKYLCEHPYFRNADPGDPLVNPSRFAQVLARFPPSLLVASTRDQLLSAVVHMHSRLVALGVETELNVWEGLDHGFFYIPDLPESREVHDVTVRFFSRHFKKC